MSKATATRQSGAGRRKCGGRGGTLPLSPAALIVNKLIACAAHVAARRFYLLPTDRGIVTTRYGLLSPPGLPETS